MVQYLNLIDNYDNIGIWIYTRQLFIMWNTYISVSRTTVYCENTPKTQCSDEHSTSYMYEIQSLPIYILYDIKCYVLSTWPYIYTST